MLFYFSQYISIVSLSHTRDKEVYLVIFDTSNIIIDVATWFEANIL